MMKLLQVIVRALCVLRYVVAHMCFVFAVDLAGNSIHNTYWDSQWRTLKQTILLCSLCVCPGIWLRCPVDSLYVYVKVAQFYF